METSIAFGADRQLAATDRIVAHVVGRGFLFFGKLAGGLAKLQNSGFIDFAMHVWGIVDMFTHTSPDSPELLYMKREFAMVNTKLDSLISGQNEIKAKLDFNAKVKAINVGMIETMNLEAYEMMQRLETDWTATGSFTEQTKRDLDNLMGRMESSGLQSMVNTMVWSVIEPAKASFSTESNIFQAFRNSKGNDCFAMATFGMQYIGLIRNATNALNFFNAIQGLSSSNTIEKGTHTKIVHELYDAVVTCLKETTDKKTGKQDLNDAISASTDVSTLMDDLDSKYFTYKWAVVKLDTTDKIAHYGKRYYTDFEPFIEEASGKDGDTLIIASYRPHSRY